ASSPTRASRAATRASRSPDGSAMFSSLPAALLSCWRGHRFEHAPFAVFVSRPRGAIIPRMARWASGGAADGEDDRQGGEEARDDREPDRPWTPTRLTGAMASSDRPTARSLGGAL